MVRTTKNPDVVKKIFHSRHFCISFLAEYSAMQLLEDAPHNLQIHRVDIKRSIIYSRRYACDLLTYILRKCPDLDDIRNYMYKILIGLYHAHNRGIVHRDIKGANIFVNYNDTGVTDLVIGDWGACHYIGDT